MSEKGRIVDQGYQPYRGSYTSENMRWRLVAARGLRSALRQGWIKVLLAIALFIVAAGAVVTFFQSTMFSAALGPNVVVYRVAIGGSSTLLLGMFATIFAGGGAIAEDGRSGAFQFYFSRPITRDQYLVGKVAPVAILVAAVSLVPTLLLALTKIVFAQSANELLHLLYLPFGAIVFGVIEAIVFALIGVLLSALSPTRGYAQAAIAGAFFLPWILGGILSTTTRSCWPKVLSLPALLDSLGRFVFHIENDPTDRTIPIGAAVVILAALAVSAAALLRARGAEIEQRI